MGWEVQLMYSRAGLPFGTKGKTSKNFCSHCGAGLEYQTKAEGEKLDFSQQQCRSEGAEKTR